MPFITVEILTGRTLDQRRQFVAAVTSAAVEILGSSAEEVRVWLVQIDPVDLARGGVLAAESPGNWFKPDKSTEQSEDGHAPDQG